VTMHDSLEQVVRDYQTSRASRRDVLKRATALGLSVPAVSALMLQASPATTAAAARQDAPKVGGVLREGFDLDFSRMDPINTNWYDPGFYALYEHVITLDPEGNYVPQLAESWETSEDGLTVTMKIVTGHSFHSGAALDAAAIKSVYDTIMDPASGSPLASLFSPVASVDAPDATTLVINLKNPYYEIYNVVSTGYWAIVNTARRAELGEDYGKQEIDGSGPFTFVEWVPGDHVTVQRWDGYAGSIVPYFENKGTAYLDQVQWKAVLEQSQRAILVENNELDSVHAPAFTDVARLESNPDLNVVKLKEWSGYILGLNWTHTDLDFHELKMRQAVSHAINREAIVQALLFGEGEPLYGPIPSADRYYTEAVEQFNQFDVEAAKALAGELGWVANADGILEKNGKAMEFNLVIQVESFNQQLGQVLQDQLKQIGMKLNVQALDRGTFFGELANADAFIFYWAWPVPIDIVPLFVSTATIPVPNWANASVPAVDDAIAAWKSAANDEQLRAAGEAFQLACAENLPVINIVNRNSVWVYRKSVHGYLPHQWNLYPYYNDVWLD